MFLLQIISCFLVMENLRADSVTVTVSPESVNVFLHDEKLILCKVQGGQADSFRWEGPNGEDIEDMGDPRLKVTSTEYSSKLHIRNAQETDEGVYVCLAELDSGEEKRARATITIIQTVSVSNVAPQREFEEGTDAVLSCTATGIPQPTVTWLHDSRDVTQSVDGRFHKLPDDSLQIRNIMISDAGDYHCVGKISERNEHKSLKTWVTVKYSPKLLQSDPEVYTWMGNPINISCSVISVPMATISWNRQTRDLGDIFPTFLVDDPPRFTSIIEVRVHNETDWGEYRCQAENILGRISGSVWVRQGDLPSAPQDVHVKSNSTSVMVLLVKPVSDGHLPLLGYKVEWRLETESEWSSKITPSEFVHVPGLRPYSQYHFRTAALNGRGQGEYSSTVSVRTLSERGEPDRPSLSAQNRIEGNSYRIYFEDVESGDSPILKYNIRYREEQASHWLNDSVNVTDYYLLKNLKWGTRYHIEVEAENEISVSSTRLINFTTPEDPRPPLPVNSAIGDNTKLGTGGIIGIILVIFVVAFAAVDVACYYTNRCGILMCIAVSILGRQDPRAKRLDQEVGVSVVRVMGHGDLTDSLEVQKINTKRSSDKLPLTRSETALDPVQHTAVNQL